MGNFPMKFETVFFDNWQVDPTAPGRTGSLKHDLPPDRLRQQQHSNSSHSNMWAQPNVNHVRIVLKSKRTVCQYQSSRFKMLRQFQFMFLFTWQSATYQIIKKSSQHRILCHSIMRADFWLTATDCRFFI